MALPLREGIAVKTWKILLACAALCAALIAAIAHHGPKTAAAGGAVARAADRIDVRHVAHSEKAPDAKTSDADYGWGPFRTTDW
jgi:hypothetical protein